MTSTSTRGLCALGLRSISAQQPLLEFAPQAGAGAPSIDARAALEAGIIDLRASIAAVSAMIAEHNRPSDHRLRMDLTRALGSTLERYRRLPEVPSVEPAWLASYRQP